MSDAIKKLRDYLAKSPSVVYPEDVLAYLPAIEAENAKLRSELESVGTAAYLYGLGDHKEENAKLRAERDEWQRVAASKQDIIDHMRDTSSSNMKLRELVEDMLSYIEIRAAFDRPPTTKMYEEFAQQARELGVEVDN